MTTDHDLLTQLNVKMDNVLIQLKIMCDRCEKHDERIDLCEKKIEVFNDRYSRSRWEVIAAGLGGVLAALAAWMFRRI